MYYANEFIDNYSSRMKTPAAMRYKTTNTKNSFITIVATAGIQSKNLNANAVNNGISNMRRMVVNIN